MAKLSCEKTNHKTKTRLYDHRGRLGSRHWWTNLLDGLYCITCIAAQSKKHAA